MQTPDTEDKICVCGDPESMHVDGCEQCFNGDCGCKEFEEKEEKVEMDDDSDNKEDNGNLPDNVTQQELDKDI